jgi:Trp operon repressor
MAVDKKALRDLYALMAAPRNPREAKLLIDDLLTPAEIRSITERWQLVQALARGMKQRDVKKKYKISISKITRGSHMLKNGGGGFKLFLKRLRAL